MLEEALATAGAMAALFDEIPDEILSDILERVVIDDFSTSCTSGQYGGLPGTFIRLTEVCRRFNMLLRSPNFLAWSYAKDGLRLSNFLLRRPPSQLRTVALDFKSGADKPEQLYDSYAPFLSVLLLSSQQCIKKLRLEGVQLRLKDSMSASCLAMEHLIRTLSMCLMLEHLQLSIIWPGLTNEDMEYPDGTFVEGSFESLNYLDISCESFSIKDFEKRFPRLETLCVRGRMEGSKTLVSRALTKFSWKRIEQYTCKDDTNGELQKLLVRGAKLRVVEVSTLWQHWLYDNKLSLALECPFLKILIISAEKTLHSWFVHEPILWGNVDISDAPMLHDLDLGDLQLDRVESTLRSIAGASRVTVNPKLEPNLAALSAKYPKVESFRVPSPI